MIEASENLSNDPDHEQVEETTLVPDEQQDVMNNTTTDHEQPDWTGQNGVQEDDQNGLPKDIPALGPSTLEECPLGPKGNRLKLDIDEKRAEGGYQDLKNCGKFWRAAVMMGTRKKQYYVLNIPARSFFGECILCCPGMFVSSIWSALCHPYPALQQKSVQITGLSKSPEGVKSK